jgi:hypothetical protein
MDLVVTPLQGPAVVDVGCLRRQESLNHRIDAGHLLAAFVLAPA